MVLQMARLAHTNCLLFLQVSAENIIDKLGFLLCCVIDDTWVNCPAECVMKSPHSQTLVKNVTCVKILQLLFVSHGSFALIFLSVSFLPCLGWLKKMKCMVMYQYSTCDMHFVHRKRCVDF